VAGIWDDMWSWLVVNWDTLLGGERPFCAKLCLSEPRSPAGVKLMRQWANSFKPARKAFKKLQAVSKFLRDGLTRKDLVLTGNLKQELLQAGAKCFVQGAPPPALASAACDSNLVGASSLANQRMLRYYDTAVVDCLCGPDCTIAYKNLCRTWSGDHPIRLGGSRANEAVGSFFLEGLHGGRDSFISRDFTLFDMSHGADAHFFFFSVMRRAGYFKSHEQAEIFSHIFPQKVMWAGRGLFTLDKGMASGAVWTTLMNTLLNGLLTTYASHRAWAKTNPHWHHTLGRFFSETKYRATYAGDDSATMGRGLLAQETQVLQVLRDLGYVVKSTSVPSVESMDFLGCQPIPCGRVLSGVVHRAMCMVPVPHRFLTTLGWALKPPSRPDLHCAGVGIGWLPSLSHIPGYGQLLVAMARSAGNTVRFTPGATAVVDSYVPGQRECISDLFDAWRDYSASALSSGSWVFTPESTMALARAWRVSPDDLLAFDIEMSQLPAMPCYVGTPSLCKIMSRTVGH
jgi:hypothetical protein